jgi:tetrathionate reductase subunit A
MASKTQRTANGRGLTRRGLMTSAALLGGTALYGRIQQTLASATPAEAAMAAADYTLNRPENTLYTVCLQCNLGCGIKVRRIKDVAVKIEGNPLSPWTMNPHLPYRTPIAEVATIDGAICPKGQSGLQTAYDPYRLRRVLKRAGPRGSNKWVTISFEQAIEEIVNGGLRVLIDPDHPDLGPKNNQFVYVRGREKGGRGDLVARFVEGALGSVNRHGHTTVCQGSLYFAGKAMSEQYTGGNWTGGRKWYWQADLESAEFVIFVGSNVFEGGYGPPLRVGKLTKNLASGKTKIAVLDPRFSPLAAKAWKWVPTIPGTDAAIALAMTRWIIEEKRYDVRYLTNANRAAAAADGEPTWSNAAWLVKVEAGQPKGFLRARDIGLSDRDLFVVLKDGRPVAVDPYDTRTAVEGDLLVDTFVGQYQVKSSMQLLYEESRARSIASWAALAGVKAEDVVALAREFTGHGKKAVIDVHRGVSQHTNGFYNALAWYTLNMLVGNLDWRGGSAWAQAYSQTGATGAPFRLATLHPGSTRPFGTSIIRHDIAYEESTLFNGYPAKRPWFPLASDIYQEVIPSAADAYPYPVKILYLHMGSPVYALPAGHTNIEILADITKIPLFIATDIVVGTSTMYADYIFPDLTYLERWEFQGTHPNVPFRSMPIFSPAIPPLTTPVRVFGEEIPLSHEAVMMGIAEKLGLPGFGKDGFGPGQDFLRPDDLYIRQVANVAFGTRAGDEVPDASPEEERLFLASRAHLPRSVFDPDRWKAILGERWWKKVVYVLNRGGRFDDYANAFDGEKLRGHYANLVHMFQEKTAKKKDPMTGRPLKAIATYVPIADSLGRPLRDPPEYNLALITNRTMRQTKSRTITNPWLTAVEPENFVVMNSKDATGRGLKDGDLVKVASATNPDGVWDLKNGTRKPMAGKLKVTEGIRPGVVAFSLGYGHWATGASDVTINGRVVKGDRRRAAGIHANAAMRTDPHMPNTCLQDIVGASAVFYDTKVKVVRA